MLWTPFCWLWRRYAAWQSRRWRLYADGLMADRNSKLEHEVQRLTMLLEIRDAEIEQAKEIINRDRARVQAEMAGFASAIAKN